MGRKTKTTEKFIEESKEVHGNKYDYSETEYVSSLVKLKIICPIHGEFWQVPTAHLKGFGCSKCSGNYRKTSEEFVALLKEKHPDSKILYDKVVYENQFSRIILTCPKHGDYDKLAISAIQNDSCPLCNVEKMREKRGKTGEEFIKEAKELYGEKFDYSKVNYINCYTHVIIICPEHGEFLQTPQDHLNGKYGCRKCSKKHIGRSKTKEQILNRFALKHGNKYDYSLVDYKGWDQKIKIICSKHGVFEQLPGSHAQGSNCPKCVEEQTTSKAEKEFSEFISSCYNKEINRNTRKLIYPYEADIYLPEINVAFEYNGLYWHSVEKLHNNLYHQMKMKMCLEKGVALYQFFEDEWIYKQDTVKSLVKRILGVPMTNIEAKSCDFNEVDKNNALNFIENNTLINNIEYNVVYGFYFENVLQSVALVNETDDYVEIMGVHDRNETIVDGAFDRVVSELKCLYSSKIMYVRVDRRLDNVQKYLNKGFVFVEEFLPDYNYVVRDFRIPKNNIEEFLENNERVLKIYDCVAERLRLVN